MFWNKNIDSRGKAVLITGCDTGFGNRLALRLNSRGFRVYATVLDSNSMGAQELVSNSYFRDIMTVIQMDVTNDQQIDDCFNTIKTELESNNEQLWAVVNNAGIVSFGLLEWGSIDEYRKLLDVNVLGVVRVTRKFLPLIRPLMGRVVLMASLGGRVAADNLGAYCMTKSAVISFSDTLRRELRKFKIKVVTIEPSVFKTAMFYSFGDSMEKNWKNTEESIKQIYGEKYFEEYSKRFKKDGKGFGAAPGKDLDLVIDDVMKAIVSPNPNRFYRPVNNKINGFLAQFIEFVPQFIIDKYFYHMNDITPEYMLEK